MADYFGLTVGLVVSRSAASSTSEYVGYPMTSGIVPHLGQLTSEALFKHVLGRLAAWRRTGRTPRS